MKPRLRKKKPRPRVIRIFADRMAGRMRFIDIGANLTDPVFRGLYRGKQAHSDDFQNVLKRAYDYGVEKIFVTGGSLPDSRRAVELTRLHESLYCTVGCHPTRCQEFEKHPSGEGDYFDSLLSLAKENTSKVVAIGECGLDYDRLQFCPKEIQLKYFEQQFSLVEATGLPMFFHCRNAHHDFMDIIRRNWPKMKGGVVHSFDGSIDEAKAFVDMGLYIGINGCSLKTEENLAAAASIPSGRLMMETGRYVIMKVLEVKLAGCGFQQTKILFI
ncbi:deoxyribonuclease TATDN1-like isoform X2 [Corticium candelabrum]|uniref:deoxyribonuclease TATDN1-like isoform X2 n=1 Tax=Corticium candelabrum TaxID=121492 RepID=UPI002E269FA0|nr:deoxyribonuclease TATDN1-like isoform X2 [Corticium candelabrum]